MTNFFGYGSLVNLQTHNYLKLIEKLALKIYLSISLETYRILRVKIYGFMLLP